MLVGWLFRLACWWDRVCCAVLAHDVRHNRQRSFCVQCGWYYRWEDDV